VTVRRGYVASTSDLLPVAEAIGSDWERVGVSGHLLARSIETGEELGFDVDELVPLASVVKVPIGLSRSRSTPTRRASARRGWPRSDTRPRWRSVTSSCRC
jgi:hypothetical protein